MRELRAEQETISSIQCYWLQKCLDFLGEIGVAVHVVDIAAFEAGFLPKIRIENGELYVREDAFPGDVLHEAGHLCTMPARFRSKASGDLREAFAAMSKFLAENPEGLNTWPESPVHRACMQSSDPEATAWQFAAAHHIQLPEEWVFPANSYEGEAKSTYFALSHNSHFGINGLQAAGWTLTRANPFRPEIPVYPKLAFWLHP